MVICELRSRSAPGPSCSKRLASIRTRRRSNVCNRRTRTRARARGRADACALLLRREDLRAGDLVRLDLVHVRGVELGIAATSANVRLHLSHLDVLAPVVVHDVE